MGLLVVLVERLAGFGLVLDAVEHGAEGQVRVATAVRAAELDALGLRIGKDSKSLPLSIKVDGGEAECAPC